MYNLGGRKVLNHHQHKQVAYHKVVRNVLIDHSMKINHFSLSLNILLALYHQETQRTSVDIATEVRIIKTHNVVTMEDFKNLKKIQRTSIIDGLR